jgi:hypothetical protein
METEGFNIVNLITQWATAENLWTIFGVMGIASLISAYVNSKSTHPNPIIRAIDQFARDTLNILAANIMKGKNADDDRPTS